MGFSCAVDCPGDYPWKALYNKSREEERQLEEACSGDGVDPTKDWKPAKSGGPYAIAFSGGMRNFLATFHSWKVNVIEASGGDVDLYFHVFVDQDSPIESTLSRETIKLAKSCPNTKGFVHEPFAEYMNLLNRDLPKARADSETSWLGDIEEGIRTNPKINRPFRVGAGYSQWRKVWLVHEMIRNSGIEYSLIIRTRPDITILYPLDLRHLQAELGGRDSSRRARGHFISIPERTLMQIVDHFAIGTPEAMYLYAKQQRPYTASCCESWVKLNLEQRCFARSMDIIRDEYVDVDSVRKAAQRAEINGTNNQERWPIVPSNLRRGTYGPQILFGSALDVMGRPACTVNEGKDSKCIPNFRTRLPYVFRVDIPAWFAAGALCTRYTNDGVKTGLFLLDSGIATEQMHEVEKKFNNEPCVHVPTLGKAWEQSKQYLESLTEKTRIDIITTGGATCSAEENM